MSDLLLMLVFLPMAAGPFGFWMGLRYPKARDTFVLAVAVLETMMVVSLWTSPVLESGIDGFCGLGIRFVSGDFHTLMATLTATGWLAATIFCREYMAHVARQNRYYLFWLMTLGATMGVFLSADLFTTFIFFEVMSFTSFVAVIGGITMVLGAVLAVCSIDLKRTFACSSVSQIGFILVGVSMQCLLGHHNALAMDGTILHIFNHSLIKMVLFPAAGVIHLSTHSYDLNEVRGFGRKKPLLAVLMGVPMLSLAGLPLLNGYVSKTLLHESIVEYIHLAPEYGVLFTGLEWLFLFSGGLTLAYMLKVFVCLFGEKNALPEKVLEQKWHGPKPYIAPATAATMGVYLVGMAVLGMAPNWGMDSLAAVARSFLHGEGPEHAVAYFSAVNLRGAAISIVVGSLVYLLVVRRWLIRRGRYIDPIPKWMNLEFGLYRPALRFAAQVAIVAATLVDRILPRLIFHGIPSLFTRGHQGLLSLRDKAVTALTGSEYTPHPSVEQAADDYHFAFYSDDPRRSVGFVHSLAFGLMLTGLGLVFGLLFILLHG